MIDSIPYTARVLVAVVTRTKDLTCVREEHWYRVPVRRAPRNLAAEYLAFYQTAAFGAERWAVRYIAPILQIDIVPRQTLLPDEADHPRATERYYRFTLGPLWRLPTPVPSRRLRRITFISTSMGQLLRAHDVVDLWHPPDDVSAIEDAVWAAGVNQR
ncbi:MAG: hypothetical protein AAGF95_28875 [Chloroflexota bacterium]